MNALAVFDDGSGPALYAGGTFNNAGGGIARRVARWDGFKWSAVGAGFNNDVKALAVFDDGSGGGAQLYAAGEFTLSGGTPAKYIARWNGSTWTAPAGGADAPARTMVTFNDGSGTKLYVGGTFSHTGGVLTMRVASWNGTTWAPLGLGMNNVVNALLVFDDGAGAKLYAGGGFTLANAMSANRVAMWNGATWSPLGNGLNWLVHALTTFDDGNGPKLYVGGEFTASGSTTLNRVARWNGSTWSPLGVGVSGPVLALATFDDGNGTQLFAGGGFQNAGGQPAKQLASWNGAMWSPLGSGVNDGVHALVTFDDGFGGGTKLYAGGRFNSSGTLPLSSMAKWDGVEIAPVAGGVNAPVRAIAVFDDGAGDGPALYAAGSFTSANSAPLGHIARWSGAKWLPLASGANDNILALTVFDDGAGGGARLVAGGAFTSAGDERAQHIASWNGAAWSALGSGTDGAVRALTTHDDGSGVKLVAGGAFNAAGGGPAHFVAAWDGATWSTLGSGMNDEVESFASFNDGSGGGAQLFAGGIFTSAGGNDANRVARWDGAAWSALGAGLDGAAHALAVVDRGDGEGPALFAGGTFASADGAPANHVAKWDGAAWSALGTGVNGEVFALLAYDDHSDFGAALDVGGAFTAAGDVTAKYVARWDGATWSSLTFSGMDKPVRALAAYQPESDDTPALAAGGEFTVSSRNDSFIARWQSCTEVIVGDVNGDGFVNSQDLALILGNWGLPGITDLDGDGTTNGFDLAIVLGAWSS